MCCLCLSLSVSVCVCVLCLSLAQCLTYNAHTLSTQPSSSICLNWLMLEMEQVQVAFSYYAKVVESLSLTPPLSSSLPLSVSVFLCK